MQNIEGVRCYLIDLFENGHVWRGVRTPFRRISDSNRRALINIAYRNSLHFIEYGRLSRVVEILKEK